MNCDIPSSCYNDQTYKGYVLDYFLWQKDGERFLTNTFINQYIENKSMPKLNDGRPELNEWFGYTNLGYVFSAAGWPFSIRNELANPFLRKMYDIYQEKKMPEECLIPLRSALVYLIPYDEYD